MRCRVVTAPDPRVLAPSDADAGMNEAPAMSPDVIDYEQHWSSSVDTYRNHPTSRHRRRFILNRIKQINPRAGQLIFDYGSGAGILLEEIKARYTVQEIDLGGCDISRAGIAVAEEKMPGAIFFAQEFPDLERKIDIAITSEVIEHTAQYREVLAWMVSHMNHNADLIITTPGGTMDPPDEYYGHVQHFTLEQLTSILEELGCTVVVARCWGYPFFTLQKWVTRRNFDRIRKSYMHGDLDWKKRAIFAVTYWLYHCHDLVSRGPQIFIHARRNSRA
jgi:SAM-dependent methyltransferase